MTLRRAAGLVLTALLVHGNVARAQIVCTGEGDHKPATENAQEHAHHEAGHSAPTDGPAKSGEVPDTPACCEAMTACSAGLEMSPPTADGTRLSDGGLVASQVLEQPHSRAAAPEPPPPRA